MVPLTMLSASCDIDASVNGSHDQKGHFAPHFNLHDLKNATGLLIILSVEVSQDRAFPVH